MKNILVIQGHPDFSAGHYCDAIAQKYASAAKSAGHRLKHINIAELDFPLLSNQAEFEDGKPCKDILDTQASITWADHVVLIYPLWLGTMPALVKGFLEQAIRPEFAIRQVSTGKPFEKLLKGKSARVFVTMGMPGPLYQWFYKAHSVKSLKRNILSFCGFKPVKYSLIGGVHEGNDERLKHQLSKVSRLGRAGR